MFGFQKVKKENYNKTFLRKVTLHVEYPQISNIKDFSKEIQELFVENFPRFYFGKDKNFQLSFGNNIADLKNIEENDSIALKSIDGKKELHLLCNNLILSIEGDEYKTFDETLKSIIEKIEKYFEIFKINSIFNISIRKINLVEFGYGGESHSNGILETLLNNDLIRNNSAFPDESKISMNIQNIDFKEDNYSLNLKYGMNTLALDKKVGQLIVDLNINNSGKIENNLLCNEISIMNDELFNVFNWIFNDTAKNMLRK